MRTADLYKLLSEKKDITIIDVRNHERYNEGHIENAKHIPLSQLPEHLEELNKQETYYMICTQGIGSQTAVNYLTEYGYQAINVDGGMNEWTGDVVVNEK